jgi:hypothetical protein
MYKSFSGAGAGGGDTGAGGGDTGSGSGPVSVLTGKCENVSKVVLTNANQTQTVLEAGTHPITRDQYAMRVYPPLKVVATGPAGKRQEMVYLEDAQAPCWDQKLTLNSDEVYDQVTISVPMAPIVRGSLDVPTGSKIPSVNSYNR